jgi:hypothetical protein
MSAHVHFLTGLTFFIEKNSKGNMQRVYAICIQTKPLQRSVHNRVHRDRDEKKEGECICPLSWSVHAPYTATLYVMVNIVKVGA